MPKKVGAETHGDIDIFVVVDVPDFCIFAVRCDDRIDHFLPERLESGHCPRIRVVRAMLGGVCLGGWSFGSVAGDEIFQRLLLKIGQPAFFAFFNRLVGAEAGIRVGVPSVVRGPRDWAETIGTGSDWRVRLAGQNGLHQLQVGSHELL